MKNNEERGMSKDPTFESFFEKATGHSPYPYQTKLATSEKLPELIVIPTGMGKTDAVVLGWLWRRRFDSREEIRAATPRRLAYCLPMRVLVEQTRDRIRGKDEKKNENDYGWLERLGLLADEPGDDSPVGGWAKDQGDKGKRIAVTVLMGGEDRKKMGEWDKHPERDAILIGTQDMLLSKALNRGYGMSRYRWPMHFGLLNNDCLWVMDEVQLMGRGFTTSIQLQAFRDCLGTMEPSTIKTIWMSATLESRWLDTVDHSQPTGTSAVFNLNQEDFEFPGIKLRRSAVKTLRKSSAAEGKPKVLAEEILQKHQQGTRTLVVLNTVRRAVDLHSALKKMPTNADLILVHSRFRPLDRRKVVNELLKNPDSGGTIIVSTQVVEAGLDISAKTLFTELAPWPSLVQRFGRCNRSGEFVDSEVYWIDLPTGEKSLAPPYVDEELDKARKILESIDRNSVGPGSLPDIQVPFVHVHVIRRKDILEMFDTTQDLAGHDLDISRFIRETSDTDVQVFWRDIPDDGSANAEPAPNRSELCSVPLSDIRDLVNKGVRAWLWDALEGSWSPVNRAIPLIPGTNIMLRSADGRYTPSEGWNILSTEPVPVVPLEKTPEESYSDNPTSYEDWETIAEHTTAVVKETIGILDNLNLRDNLRTQLIDAARWHDAGKAHPAFQDWIRDEMPERLQNYPVAKAPENAWLRGRLPDQPREGDLRRKHFRHELASGILALMNGKSDLISYLVAAHHGKVRLSIRSLPGEYKPSMGERFARGIWEGDEVPEVDLGGGIWVSATTINLSYMDLGSSSSGPSWLSRMTLLRDSSEIGPFRLAYMEALIKAADERASRGGA